MKPRKRQGIKRRIIALLKAGASLAEAARREGIARQTVYNWMARDRRFWRAVMRVRPPRRLALWQLDALYERDS